VDARNGRASKDGRLRGMADLDVDTAALNDAAAALHRASGLGRVLAAQARHGAPGGAGAPVDRAVDELLGRWQGSLQELAASSQALVDLLQRTAAAVVAEEQVLSRATGR